MQTNEGTTHYQQDLFSVPVISQNEQKFKVKAIIGRWGLGAFSLQLARSREQIKETYYLVRWEKFPLTFQLQILQQGKHRMDCPKQAPGPRTNRTRTNARRVRRCLPQGDFWGLFCGIGSDDQDRRQMRTSRHNSRGARIQTGRVPTVLMRAFKRIRKYMCNIANHIVFVFGSQDRFLAEFFCFPP
jgi:hypothetical protein